MNDLGAHIFNTANAMNRAKAAEIQTKIVRWDTPSEHKAEGFSALGVPLELLDAQEPLRKEVTAMLEAAELYREHAAEVIKGAELHEFYARANREQAAKLEELAQQVTEQAHNLRAKANL